MDKSREGGVFVNNQNSWPWTGWFPVSTSSTDIIQHGCPADIRRELEEQLRQFQRGAKTAACFSCKREPAGSGAVALLANWAHGRAEMIPAVYACARCWGAKKPKRLEREARAAVEAMIETATRPAGDLLAEAGVVWLDADGAHQPIEPFSCWVTLEDGSSELGFSPEGIRKLRDRFTREGDADKALLASQMAKALEGWAP